MKNIAAQNENPVRVEQNLVQKDFAKDQETSRSCTVKLGDGNTYLQIDRPNNSEGSEAERQEILDLLSQVKENKKLYHQLFEIEEPRGDSKTGILEDSVNRIRGGENLGKAGPGPRAKADVKNAKVKSGVTQAWVQNSSQRSRPKAADQLGQQLTIGGSGSSSGFLDRLSPPSGPGPDYCGRGPRSITVVSSQKGQTEYQPDGYSDEQMAMFEKHPNYLELAKDPQLIGKEHEITPKSKEEAGSIIQAEKEGLVSGAVRPNLQAGDPNYDYKTEGPRRFADIKVPRNATVEDAVRLGEKSALQRGNDDDVTLVVNLMRLRPENRAAYAEAYQEAAGGNGVVFINK
jgi:hypothetical protein